ncbi:MAG: branched-chain amino acid ABC transporter permease [Acetobacteraceae bacterium]
MAEARSAAAPLVSPSTQWVMRWGALVVIATIPLLAASDYQLRFFAQILTIGIAVLGLDLLVGFGGLISLGHAAFFAAAGYAAAFVSRYLGADLVLVLVVGIATGSFLAMLFGIAVAQTVNLFFLILTLILGQMVWEVVFHWRDVTGGADGLRGLPPLALHIGLGTAPLASGRALYLVAVVVAALAVIAARSFVDAPLGRALLGLRERPLRMSALGYSIPRLRMQGLIASGALAGAGGGLYPFINQYIGPDSAHWTMSASMVIMLIIGGVGSLYGAFVGAAIYLTIQTYLSSYTDRWQLLVGLVFVLTVLFMPKGVVAGATSVLSRLRGGRAA